MTKVAFKNCFAPGRYPDSRNHLSDSMLFSLVDMTYPSIYSSVVYLYSVSICIGGVLHGQSRSLGEHASFPAA